MAAIFPLSRSRRGLLVKNGSNGIFPVIGLARAKLDLILSGIDVILGR